MTLRLGFALLALFFAGLPVFGGDTVIPLRMLGHLAVVPVFVNGEGPFRFAVDTGSESSLIDSLLAGKLGLQPTERVEIVTVAGVRALPTGPATLRLGSFDIHVTDLTWMDAKSYLSRVRLDGILGQDVLSGFNYLLDYDRHKLILSGLDHETTGIGGSKLPCRVTGSRCEIRVPLSIQGQLEATSEAVLLLDSGAECLTLLNTKAQQFEGMLDRRRLESVSLLTHSGPTQQAFSAIIPKLLVAGRMLMEASVVMVRGRKEETGDGLLPTSLFRSVYFSNATATVILNPARK